VDDFTLFCFLAWLRISIKVQRKPEQLTNIFQGNPLVRLSISFIGLLLRSIAMSRENHA